jgi:predicted NBD/HSP70 family sugar kinase
VSDKGSMTPSAAQIRWVNADTVYAAMRREGASTASDLMALSGLTRPTVHAACEWLISQGLVEELGGAGPQEPQPGRPAKRYRVIGDAGYVIALEIRETAVAVGVADLTGRILDERAMEIAADPEFDSQGSVHGPAVIRAALEQAGIRDDQVWQVCVSVPAPVRATLVGDDATRRHRSGARQLIEHLRDALPWPLAAENDANLAMLGELWQGVAQGADSAVLLDICQHGFGAGLIVNGDLVRGKNGVAGEMSAVDLFSDMGPVGGVLEKARVLGARYVAGGGEPGSVLVARSGGDPAKITAHIVFDAAQAGDPCARSIVDQLGAAVARPIAMLSTLLDPELVVLYGMDDEVADLLEPVIRSRTAELFDKQFDSPMPRLERSRLGSRGSLVGGVRRALLEVEGRLFESPLAQASRPAAVARA